MSASFCHLADHAARLTCPYPPCINAVQRPDPQLGAINSFESESSSLYNGLTVSLKRQMSTWHVLPGWLHLAKAIDDGQDALVVGRPGNVQNSYATALERGPSVTDQRNRFVAATGCGARSFISISRML